VETLRFIFTIHNDIQRLQSGLVVCTILVIQTPNMQTSNLHQVTMEEIQTDRTDKIFDTADPDT
jgi:hypothetical protein